MSDQLNHDFKEAAVARCPFDDEEVNVFQVPNEGRLFPASDEMVWVIECKNMGCICPRTGYVTNLDWLIEQWNKRGRDSSEGTK